MFDHNDLLALNRLGLDIHLLIVLQRASTLSFSSHALNRIHDVSLLCQEDVTQIGGPLNVFCEKLDDIRQRRHCLDARIPRLFLNFARQLILVFCEPRILFQELLELNNLQRIS